MGLKLPTAGELFSRFFDIGVDILASTLDAATGTITAQLGDVTKDRADSDRAELWFGAPGFVSRPALPTQGKASCQGLVLKGSVRDRVFAYRDLRATAIYGNLEPGASAAFATSGMARSLWKADGSSRQYTTDNNAASGNAVFAGVSSYYQGTDGQAHLGGEWRYYGPWGGAWQDQTGYHLRTWHGVKVDAGGFVLPAPISAHVSWYSLSADTVTIKGGVVNIGSNDGTQQGVVQALPLQTLMLAFATDLATFTTALTTYAGAIQQKADPPNAATPALVGACTALAASVAALMATIQLATSTKATLAN